MERGGRERGGMGEGEGEDRKGGAIGTGQFGPPLSHLSGSATDY
jgi:hypothetical protein